MESLHELPYIQNTLEIMEYLNRTTIELSNKEKWHCSVASGGNTIINARFDSQKVREQRDFSFSNTFCDERKKTLCKVEIIFFLSISENKNRRFYQLTQRRRKREKSLDLIKFKSFFIAFVLFALPGNWKIKLFTPFRLHTRCFSFQF